jgi:hypothetical protein
MSQAALYRARSDGRMGMIVPPNLLTGLMLQGTEERAVVGQREVETMLGAIRRSGHQ